MPHSPVPDPSFTADAPLARSAPAYSALVARLRSAGCVFAEDEADVLLSAALDPADLDKMAERRAAGVPLEHVVGWAEFAGLRVAVDPGVFVPRRRTEFLVGQAARLAPERPAVVDLCCGSGALGAALAALRPGAELHAADVDPAAVACARRNVAAFGGAVYSGDLYDPLPRGLRGSVDVLLANVPYVPTGEIGLLPGEARDHEARTALDGGPDGLATLRRVSAAAPGWLAPGGRLLFETSERQAETAAAIAAGDGLDVRVADDEEIGATVVVATAPGC
ncbi:putative protein N(5)-glutamine methyltransferase [Streptomonospora wellingtoniae]|uniref:peptide chain release factor N(5)-glutamine methyltransferase n=1 Tax=Streptomonospora wellingtoniae TaxID=3075544 RepID=A0ABU2KS35_9ACTN|nr:putative protein N(5)-glutamine methyltransferase [Streptomonospora sp. DSM 45055]MDT0302079.1 putative protein N(5)-glutamine methyltransferase [Streptomonospora sp. DSM 45055]